TAITHTTIGSPRVSAPLTLCESMIPSRGFFLSAGGRAYLPAQGSRDWSVMPASFQRVKYQYTVLPGRQVGGQVPPGAAGAHHVQDGVDHLVAGVLLRVAAGVGRGSRGSNNAHWSSIRSEGQVGSRVMKVRLTGPAIG